MCDLHEMATNARRSDAGPQSYDAWRNSERLQRYQAKRAGMIAADPLGELHRIVRGVAAKTRFTPDPPDPDQFGGSYLDLSRGI